ncbi:MAG: helix-turn-helix transcriptional regulator [Brevundimonas sp.]|uniref:helix-turn-helix domain-containing protein n=1 Tax=Brevundimonas sp. TaxID=1871086 RepID=UPI002733893D|nr:helix-turn-helix transcriptional regulator [Brevundimonas sp.]MDP3406596.1 helix-turn-helix transcriptional regulator [Brevundimonas sp.]
MITPEAQRAARSLLGWGVRDLAAKAGLSWTTVSQFENGRPLRDANAAKIVEALQAHGVELIADDDRTGAVLVYARRRD